MTTITTIITIAILAIVFTAFVFSLIKAAKGSNKDKSVNADAAYSRSTSIQIPVRVEPDALQVSTIHVEKQSVNNNRKNYRVIPVDPGFRPPLFTGSLPKDDRFTIGLLDRSEREFSRSEVSDCPVKYLRYNVVGKGWTAFDGPGKGRVRVFELSTTEEVAA